MKESSAIVPATFVKKKGFVCDNHVLYCPNLSKADPRLPFYLNCSRHHVTFKVDLSKQGKEFISEFPNGSKES